MSEDVNIRINFQKTGEGDREALRTLDEIEQRGGQTRSGRQWSREVAREHPETVRKIQELRRAATAYEDKGHFDLAKSARADADELGGQLARRTRERTKDEQTISRERREQEQTTKRELNLQNTHDARLRSGGRFALNLAQHAAGTAGMGGIGGFMPMLGMGAVGMVASVAAGTLGLYANQWMGRRDEDARVKEHAIEDANRTGRISSLRGERGQRQAAGNVERLRGELEGLEDQKGMFQKKGWGDFFKGIFNGTKNAGLLGIVGSKIPDLETNETKERERAKMEKEKREELARAEKTAQERFADSPEGWNLQARNRFLRNDLKGAQRLRDKADAEREFQRVKEASGSEEKGMEAASLTLQEKDRERGLAYGRLVNARSGAGDIARAADLATQQMNGSQGRNELLGALRDLHQTVQTQHTEALNWKPHRGVEGR